jgi:glycine reductase
MDGLAQEGITSVGIYAEMSGPEGTGPPVVVPPSKAAAGMISVGNYDEKITLPAVEKALGGEKFDLLDVPATEELEVPHAVIYCSLSPLGWGRLTAKEGASEAVPAPAEEKEEHEGPFRIVHYINQFFAGLGGEDKADTEPATKEGAHGPGKKLAQLLGDEYEIVATVYCGDDHAVSSPEVTDKVLELVKEGEPDLLVAGPAFTSGRYGLACARLAAAAQEAGIAVVASLHEDNPGIDEAAGAPVVAAEESARKMGPTLERLAAAVKKVATGESFTSEDGRVGKAPRRNVVAEKNAAERAVDLLLARLRGDEEATEVPLPRFERVKPAGPVENLEEITLALVTEGALVPDGNPDKLESARATKWLRYSLEGIDSLPEGEWQSVHGGFSTQWANDDPHRILPLDVARELVEEGRIGSLQEEYFVTAGNGTSVNNAKRFGVEWAADLRKSGARAAILTST